MVGRVTNGAEPQGEEEKVNKNIRSAASPGYAAGSSGIRE